MGTITASNFRIYQSTGWNLDTTSEGGGASATQIQFDVPLSGTLEFAASTEVVGTDTSFTTEISIGDLLYNGSNDIYTSAVRVIAITDNTHLTLANNYSGTTGSGKVGNRIPKNTVFPDVTDAQRQTGVTQYRKIFVYNNNTDLVRLKTWINSNYSAPNETISMSTAGTASGTVGTDSVTTTGVNGSAWQAPENINDARAGKHVQDLGSIGNAQSKWIWLKRLVTPGGDGYINDQFVIGIGMY
jgi:hypothetical protein